MLLYAVGTSLLTHEEAVDESSKIARYVSEVSSAAGKALEGIPELRLPTGVLSAEATLGLAAVSAPGLAPAAEGPGLAAGPPQLKRVGFKEIGVGLPLCIDIRGIYTGKFPESFMGNTKPMLITSAIKGMATFEAKPLAVNFLMDEVAPGTRLQAPPADRQGTPIIYYSPAVMDRSLDLDLKMVFQKFPAEAFNAVAKGMESAAKIPIFLSASGYMLAASTAIQLASTVADKFLNGQPVLELSEAIDLNLPGEASAVAGFLVALPAGSELARPDMRTRYKVQNRMLCDDNGDPYNGESPYIILALDGSARPELEGFVATAASAALMSKFLPSAENTAAAVGQLVEAVKLYNDFTFRQKSDSLEKQIAATKDPAEKAELQAQHDAVVKNIQSDLMKPGA